MSNVVPFPKVPRPLRPRGRTVRPEPVADHRFREATKRRLRSVLAAVLAILDSLDRQPRRS